VILYFAVMTSVTFYLIQYEFISHNATLYHFFFFRLWWSASRELTGLLVAYPRCVQEIDNDSSLFQSVI